MQFPALDDTIIAVSSGWLPSRIGIVRLSGPDSFAHATSLGLSAPTDPPSPAWTTGRITLSPGITLPATALWFRQPRSYTGQDLIELHTVGSLPLLRELSAHLIDRGARRALPGEFTARAYLAGKLNAAQVEDVLLTIHAGAGTSSRQAARGVALSRERRLDDVREALADLLSLVEAGIDFVEEEDVRLIEPAELASRLDELLTTLASMPSAIQPRLGQPHVALVGLPNAGKSTLFNALVGGERAIVSPILGTTRDVLSAEIELSGVPVVLQDCAGLGQSSDELELAAHLAAERAADQADLVLWVHAQNEPWTSGETQAATRTAPDRRLIVASKTDLPAPATQAFADLGETLPICATTGAGLPTLQTAIARRLSITPPLDVSLGPGGEEIQECGRAIERARALITPKDVNYLEPELIALELRSALETLTGPKGAEVVEEILGRVFARFCVGK
ncbi:MAG: 50S ribosome-binding GTPase [Phycisphaerae bacterium]|jgi:tRNA modification GTPase